MNLTLSVERNDADTHSTCTIRDGKAIVATHVGTTAREAVIGATGELANKIDALAP